MRLIPAGAVYVNFLAVGDLALACRAQGRILEAADLTVGSLDGSRPNYYPHVPLPGSTGMRRVSSTQHAEQRVGSRGKRRVTHAAEPLC